jgi:hypothetical protein
MQYMPSSCVAALFIWAQPVVNAVNSKASSSFGLSQTAVTAQAVQSTHALTESFPGGQLQRLSYWATVHVRPVWACVFGLSQTAVPAVLPTSR